MYKCLFLPTGACVCAHKHTQHRSGRQIRLAGGNCGLYYSKRCSPCVNHSKLHSDGRLKVPEQTAAPSGAAPPLPQEEGEIHISWLRSPFPWAGTLQFERNHHNSKTRVPPVGNSLLLHEPVCGAVRLFHVQLQICACAWRSLLMLLGETTADSCYDVRPNAVKRVRFRWLGWGVVSRLMERKHLRPLGPGAPALTQNWGVKNEPCKYDMQSRLSSSSKYHH